MTYLLCVPKGKYWRGLHRRGRPRKAGPTTAGGKDISEAGRLRLRTRRVVLPIGSSASAGGGRNGSSEGWSRRFRRGEFFRLRRTIGGRVRRAEEACAATDRRRAGLWRGARGGFRCSRNVRRCR